MTRLYKSIAAVTFALCLAFSFGVSIANGSEEMKEKEYMKIAMGSKNMDTEEMMMKEEGKMMKEEGEMMKEEGEMMK